MSTIAVCPNKVVKLFYCEAACSIAAHLLFAYESLQQKFCLSSRKSQQEEIIFLPPGKTFLLKFAGKKFFPFCCFGTTAHEPPLHSILLEWEPEKELLPPPGVKNVWAEIRAIIAPRSPSLRIRWKIVYSAWMPSRETIIASIQFQPLSILLQTTMMHQQLSSPSPWVRSSHPE